MNAAEKITVLMRAMEAEGCTLSQVIGVIERISSKSGDSADKRSARNKRYYDLRRLKASESRLKVAATPDMVSSEPDVVLPLVGGENPGDSSQKIKEGSPPHSPPLQENIIEEGQASSKNENQRRRGKPIPEDWKPTASDIEFARERGMSEKAIADEAEGFVEYWSSKSGKDAMSTNWSLNWKRRIRFLRPVDPAPQFTLFSHIDGGKNAPNRGSGQRSGSNGSSRGYAALAVSYAREAAAAFRQDG